MGAGFRMPAPPEFKYLQDPRFRFKITERASPHSWVYVDAQGDQASFDPLTARPWVDLDAQTQLGDMQAIAAGKGGTSEGDAWSPQDIATVHRLLKQNGGRVDGELVRLFKEHLLLTRDPHFMSTHPGKKPYAWPGHEAETAGAPAQQAEP